MLRAALKSLVHFLRADRSQNYPIPGVDWQYHRLCRNCDDYGPHVTVGGVNGQQHCYHCGHRSEPVNLISEPEKAKSCVRSSWDHWQRWPVYPYNWHTLSEEEKEALIRRE